jgi:hypothetical protein
MKYRKFIVILTLIIILILFLLVLFYYKKNISEFSDILTEKKNAIVALTRGYNDNANYGELINRNKAIYDIYYSKLANKENMDVVLFNEGNITNEQQQYIQNQTPEMPIIFKTIIFYDEKPINDKCPPMGAINRFSIGYKNMCNFWSIEFLEYCKEYNYIIRIDEDCIIHRLESNLLQKYESNEIYFAFARMSDYGVIDVPEYIVGMKEFFENFIEEHKITPYKSFQDIRCPYTNFMVVNIQFIRDNKFVMDCIEKIKNTNCIFSNRWGDLPIWGYILSLLIEEKNYLNDTEIQYFHSSHDVRVNY